MAFKPRFKSLPPILLMAGPALLSLALLAAFNPGSTTVGQAAPLVLQATATNTPLIIIAKPSPTPTNTQPAIITQPSATPTDPPSSVASPTPTEEPPPTRTPPPTDTPLPLAQPSPTPTPGVFTDEELPSPTPHFDPVTPQIPLTLPSPTPTAPVIIGEDVPDLRIMAVEVTQGMQNLDNDMPLVASRWTVVRVYVCTDGGDWPDIRGGLQALRDDVYLSPAQGELAGKALAPANGPITADESCGDRLNLNDSLYFYLPTSWTTEGTLELNAYVYATHPQSPFENEPNPNNNFAYEHIEFETANPAIFRFYPLHLHEDFDGDKPNATFNPSEFTFGTVGGLDIANDMFRKHPIAELYVQLSDDVVSPAHHVVGNEWDLTDDDEESEPLTRLAWHRSWEDGAPWYVGMVSHSLLTDGMYDGLARGDKSVAWVVMETTKGEVTPWYIKGGYTLTHELGHLAGLSHAPCRDADDDDVADEEAGGDLDTDFPTGHPNCSIAPVDPEGFYGFDVYWQLWAHLASPTVISNDPSAPRPHLGFPMMGYQSPQYIDAYHYCLLLDYYDVNCFPQHMDLGYDPPGGGTGPGQGGDCTPDTPPKGVHLPFPSPQWELCLTSEGKHVLFTPTNTEALVALQGEVNFESGEARLTQAAVLEDAASSLRREMADGRRRLVAKDSASDYLLSLENEQGTPLFSMTLLDDLSRHGTAGSLSFTEMIPYLPAGRILRIRHEDRVIAEMRASANPPTVDFLPSPGGAALPIELAWRASDPDGDPLSFTLSYSPDGGVSWKAVATQLSEASYQISEDASLPGSEQGIFRVTASDGFLTASDDSPFTIELPDRNPLPLIYSPADRHVFARNAVVMLSGAATDPEDGSLPPAALRWSSDLDGALGEGPELLTRELSPGLHELTLTATDSAGNRATSQVRVAIDPDVERWLPSSEEQELVGNMMAEHDPAEAAATGGLAIRPPWPLLVLALLGLAGLVGVGLVVYGLWPRGRG